MKVFYSDQPLNLDLNLYTIFLAGPTPRSEEVKSWRPEALNILKKINFSGQVLVPEQSDKKWKNDYLDQVEWEFSGLSIANAIVFWIPRKLPEMPAFTTNVEFGL